MAAPESSPELSVVDDHAEPSQVDETPAAGSATQPDDATTETRPVASPSVTAPEPAQPQEAKRRGVPWWVVVVVAVLGLILFLNQYQRAEGLDARVTSLTDELLVADQSLRVAEGHVAAHQAHLDQVRSGVASLSDQVAGLQALADRDPLSPVPVVTKEPAVVPPPAENSAVETTPAPSTPAEGSLTDAEGYYWRADGDSAAAQAEPAPAATDAERRSIIFDAVGTPFAER